MEQVIFKNIFIYTYTHMYSTTISPKERPDILNRVEMYIGEGLE